ncbi:unnamed protein product [Alternaria sp. RS040]
MKFLATIILLTFFAAMIIAGDCMKAPFQCKESKCGEYHAARSALLSKLDSALLSYKFKHNTYKFKHNTYKFKHNTYKFKHNTETFINNEIIYTSQSIYTGKNAALTSAASFTLAILLHLSLLYEEKNVPYVYVLSKMALELSCK